ncbi:MAG: hypothetical protein NDF54_02455 [archaeon GB-1867-035]|nr:hypothetical protein [Candidatus Culexmicrobium profundum]
MLNRTDDSLFRLSLILLLFGGFILLSSNAIGLRLWQTFTLILGLICLILGFIIGLISTFPSKRAR